MWWQLILGIVIAAIVGAAIYWVGWQIGYGYGREEGAYDRYVEAMRNEVE